MTKEENPQTQERDFPLSWKAQTPRFPHSHRTTTAAVLASKHNQTKSKPQRPALLATFPTYPQIPPRKQKNRLLMSVIQPTRDDHNHERTPRPDIVRENHRQPSGQRDYADDQHHRRILKKGGHRLHGNLPASHHRELDDNAVTDRSACLERLCATTWSCNRITDLSAAFGNGLSGRSVLGRKIKPRIR